MRNPLRDKTALVTGASSGIGAAIARALAAEGVHLGIAGRDDDRLKMVGDVIAQHRVDVWRYTADMTVDEEIQWLAETAEEDLGAVDILIHSAGLLGHGSVAEQAPEEVEQLFRVNVLAPSRLTQLLLPALITTAGDIVFINSRAGLHAVPGLVHYSASKAALRALADGLREEVGQEGVRVLSVYPGRVATPMQQTLCDAQGMDYAPDRYPGPEDVAQAVVAALKMQGPTEITEINIGPQRNPAARERAE